MVRIFINVKFLLGAFSMEEEEEGEDLVFLAAFLLFGDLGMEGREGR